jgi:hypothetical protein
MIEVQEIFQKLSDLSSNDDNSYSLARVNEVLLKFFYNIEKLDRSLEEQQTALQVCQEASQHLNNQYLELKFVKENEIKKNQMSINYNEQLLSDLNLIEGENANFLQQRDMFFRENLHLKEQLAELED